MDINKILQSKIFRWTIFVFGALVLVLGSFALGTAVGYRKAKFFYDWGDNYDRNFGGPRRGLFGFEPGSNFTNSYGITGSIVSMSSSSFVISGRDKMEKTILLSTSTVMRQNRGDITANDLEKGEVVIVLGAPNSAGQIQAELIRVLPSPHR